MAHGTPVNYSSQLLKLFELTATQFIAPPWLVTVPLMIEQHPV
jgi:hypothetical protein